MRTLLYALLIAAASSSPVHAETIIGPAKVADGDTVTVQERRIRLFGIDAPELAQTCRRDAEQWACGRAAADHLTELIGSNEIECVGDEVDQYGRLVAVCWISGVDLNQSMVADGWATAFRTYSDAYVADETRAKARRAGIWSSEFELPETYRYAQRPLAPRAEQRSASRRSGEVSLQGGCVIKGNRNRRGQWIYHLPGMPYYDATRAEEMFCTEEAARAAGYRRAIVR